ncbi:hypothetical protein GPECTOR_18g60 [Gonium pectorale]|uniref:peptidylprolyl isomerase n=1 Tax=Gonium pectorale TaxID=33097 RepID=A0A150GJU2_GONPE|nr:hypothetical protein GPECTOR_18g60 [Gonium pectorale]|eukprot:KXZ50083.1 hypothetical protein GPECTOR_18g60 [Gonium pectorale]
MLLAAESAVAMSAAAASWPGAASADDFVTLPSGLKVLTIRYDPRIDNTSVRDEPYEFKLGAGQAIPAFELAVQNMRAGGISRVEVPGDRPELGYPLDRSQRFTGELISPDLKIYKYRYGPQPAELGGQRALDFVLDNATLRDFNRTLLFDIKLLAVRRPRA